MLLENNPLSDAFVSICVGVYHTVERHGIIPCREQNGYKQQPGTDMNAHPAESNNIKGISGLQSQTIKETWWEIIRSPTEVFQWLHQRWILLEHALTGTFCKKRELSPFVCKEEILLDSYEALNKILNYASSQVCQGPVIILWTFHNPVHKHLSMLIWIFLNPFFQAMFWGNEKIQGRTCKLAGWRRKTTSLTNVAHRFGIGG